jgi:hypothetical protein
MLGGANRPLWLRRGAAEERAVWEQVAIWCAMKYVTLRNPCRVERMVGSGPRVAATLRLRQPWSILRKPCGLLETIPGQQYLFWQRGVDASDFWMRPKAQATEYGQPCQMLPPRSCLPSLNFQFVGKLVGTCYVAVSTSPQSPFQRAVAIRVRCCNWATCP